MSIGLVVDSILVCSSEVHSLLTQIIPPSRVIIVIKKEIIFSIGIWNSATKGDYNVIDSIIEFPLGSTLLPGFIDCHVHLTIAKDDYQIDHLKLSSAEKALRALKCAQGLLQAGFTTLRSAGDADAGFPSFAVAKSIHNGDFVGPRIVGAGHYISTTGGGGDINFLSSDACHCVVSDGVIADGKDEMIKAVRNEIKYGSDWIKVLVTGAFMTSSTNAKDSPENTHVSKDELMSLVEGIMIYMLDCL